MAEIAEEENWRDDSITIPEMNKYMFEHQIRVDCTFRVGSDPEKAQMFHSHKFVLARSSCVFDAMFYGSLREEKEIRVTDVEPSVFALLLNYIYTYEVHLDNVKDAVDLALAANKYMLKSLTSKCVAFMCHNVDVTNVLRCLELTSLIENQQLKTACVKVLQKHTRIVIHSDHFKEIPESILILLLDQESLSCHEFELVRASEIWAENQAKLRGMSADDDNIRACLEENILPRLRFLSMTQTEFEAISQSWLTETEKSFILSNIQNKNNMEEVPSKISLNKTPRYSKKADCYENILTYSSKNKQKFTLKRTIRAITYHNSLRARIRILGNNDWLLGVSVHSQIKTPELVSEYGEVAYQNKDLPDFYNENIVVTLYDCKSNITFDDQHYEKRNVLGSQSYTSLSKYNSFTDIIFDKPIYLKSDNLSAYVIEVEFKNAGVYPVSNLLDSTFSNRCLYGTSDENIKNVNLGMFKSLYIIQSSDLQIMYPHCYYHVQP